MISCTTCNKYIKERNTSYSISSNQRPDMKKRAELLVEKAWACPAIKNLYDRANAIHSEHCGDAVPHDWSDWKITFCDADVPPVQFRGLCDVISREILLSTNLNDDEALSILTFELTNAVSSEQFRDLNKQATSGMIDCELFVKKMLETEYKGAKLYHQIMQEAIKEMGWNKEVDECISEHLEDFETAYHKRIKFESHAAYYRAGWSRLNGQNVSLITLKEMLKSSKRLFSDLSAKKIVNMLIRGGIAGGMGAFGMFLLASGEYKALGWQFLAGGVAGGMTGVLAWKTLRPFELAADHGYRFLGTMGMISAVAVSATVGMVFTTQGMVGAMVGHLTGAIAYPIFEKDT